jgi:cell division protein FtsQ
VASTRRPTYRPAKPAARDTGADSPGDRPAAGRQDTAGNQPAGVITASKSAPAATGSSGTGASKSAPAAPAKGKAAKAAKAQPAPDKEQAKQPPDNVLAFPEPRGRRIRRNLIVSVCLTAALVAGLIAAAIYSPVLAVQSVSVTGTKLLKPAQVQAALKPLLGTPLPQVSDDDVSSLLKPLVQIKSVTTQAHPPSVLVVHVQERVPVALVKRGNEYMLVDVDGVRLSTTADPASVKLPVIDGGAGTIGKDLFQATAEVLGALPANVLAKLSNASAKSVDAVELKLLDGQTVIWGNAGEKELKARVLEALLKVPADPANPVNTYDVSAPRHPVTR